MRLHDLIDHHCHVESLGHSLSPHLKVTVALIIIATAIITPMPGGWIVLGMLAAFLIFATAISRLPIVFLAERLLLLEPFVLGVAALAVFRPNGLANFMIAFTRSTLCLLTIIILAGTTQFTELIQLLKRLGAPSILVSVVALMYRYLFVLIDETDRMLRARSSRTFTSNRTRRWRTSASIIGQLFMRSVSRANRVYSAMCARGWE